VTSSNRQASWTDRGKGGTCDEVQRGWLPRKLVEMYARGTIIASVCWPPGGEDHTS
jgi:hypothetical protein